ncbi:MAG: NADH-quinone oxidoreductase subunit N [Caldilineaceae bacterium]|nr:NADH-quinone oxidoreductase subunit N [Caldilineaceae bacterium]
MDTALLFDNAIVLLPELVLAVGVIVLMIVDIGRRGENGAPLLAGLSVAILLLGIGASLLIWGRPPAEYLGGAISDGFALSVRLVILIAGVFGVLLSRNYLPDIERQGGAFYSLQLLAIIGMMLMGTATNLIVLFIALEIFSLALYILCGFYRESPRSIEAAMKYFLLGAFASTFFVYGSALLFGAGGSTHYARIHETLAAGGGNPSLVLPGIALLLVGFGFKVSLVPFHMWTPDVYQGAPTPVTAFMSVGTKAAAFAGFFRLMMTALPSFHDQWAAPLAILAVLTMTVGNLTALRQSSVKRMLAYSGIAHAGNILIALVAGTGAASSAAAFYLFTYAFMNAGAFAVVIALEKKDGGENDVEQSSLAGIAEKFPALAAAMAIFMLSLSGIPPLAGFFGKFLVFKAAVEAGWAWLVVIGVLNSAISAYYYLRIVVAMYFQPLEEEGEEKERLSVLASRSSLFVVTVAAIAVVMIGLQPGLWTGVMRGLGQ